MINHHMHVSIKILAVIGDYGKDIVYGDIVELS